MGRRAGRIVGHLKALSVFAPSVYPHRTHGTQHPRGVGERRARRQVGAPSGERHGAHPDVRVFRHGGEAVREEICDARHAARRVHRHERRGVPRHARLGHGVAR